MSTLLDQSDHSFELIFPWEKRGLPLWVQEVTEQIMVCWAPTTSSFCLKCKHCGNMTAFPTSATGLRQSVLKTSARHVQHKCKTVPQSIKMSIWRKQKEGTQSAQFGFWSACWDRMCAQRPLAEAAPASSGGQHQQACNKPAPSIDARVDEAMDGTVNEPPTDTLAVPAAVSEPAKPPADTLPLADPDGSPMLPSSILI
jgi:hypothetical protein